MATRWSKDAQVFRGSVQDMINQPPQRFVKKVELFCPHCGNPQTFILGTKNLRKKFQEEYCQIILYTIRKNNLRIFTKKSLLSLMELDYPQLYKLTKGELQLKALSVLAGLGFIKKIRKEFVVGKKKTRKKFKWMFSVNKTNELPKCYNQDKDGHLEKVNWEEREYFDSRGENEQ